MKRFSVALIPIILACWAPFFSSCGGGTPSLVLGHASSEVSELTPSAAHIGINKFAGKTIKVKMTYKSEAVSENPLLRRFLFRGEEREFAVMINRGTFEDVIEKMNPGDEVAIIGILKAPETDKYLEIHVQ